MHDGTDVRPRHEHGQMHRQLDARRRSLDKQAIRSDEAHVLRPQRFVGEPGRRDSHELAGPRARVPLGTADKLAGRHQPQRVRELLANL